MFRLRNCDKDNISNSVLKKIKKYTAHDEFNSDFVKSKSIAAAAMCDWVCAIEIYSHVYRDVR